MEKRYPLKTRKVTTSNYTKGNGDQPIQTQSFDEYAKALVNPWLMIPAKIPDIACFPTTNVLMDQTFTWALDITGGTPGSANNQLLKVVFGPMRVDVAWYHGDATGTYGVQTTTAAYTPRTYAPGGSTATNTDSYRLCRLVSAGVSVEVVGTDSQQSGIFMGIPGERASAPYIALADTFGYSLAEQGSAPLTYTTSVINGIKYTYRPVDSDSFSMVPVLDYSSVTSANLTPNLGTFFLIVSGGVSGAPYKVNIVANWEATLARGADNIMATTSPVDPASLTYGVNKALNFPAVESIVHSKLNH